FVTGCDSGSQSSIRVEDPWIRLPAVPERPAVGYGTLVVKENVGALVGVSSPRARTIEIHQTVTRGSMASMRKIDAIQQLNPDFVFEPGGMHLMLFEVDRKLKSGDKADLVFRFEYGRQVTASAIVVGAGDSAPY
ncbi:MAG: copper chaperone PCu(A)C, partial [Gammaproteobacteria bacterium]